MATLANNKAQLLDSIVELAQTRLAAQQQSEFIQFVRRYYAHATPEDLLELNPEDLYGAALSHWNLARQRLPGNALIKVYNPVFEEHGWQSTHTVIEIVTDDMPFLVDSVVMALNQHSLRVHLLIHPVLQLVRDEQGKLLHMAADDSQKHAYVESFMHCEVDRHSDEQSLRALQQELSQVLNDVRGAVEDWPAMREHMRTIADQLEHVNTPVKDEELAEIKAFLQWLVANHFTFLGYRDYELIERNGEPLLRTVANSGLGVLRDDGTGQVSPSFAELPPQLRRLASEPELLIVSKSSARSTVHRPGHMDYIGIKRFDETGKVIGEQRFLGLYTSPVYNLLANEIPLLRRKLEAISEHSGLATGGHAGKALQHILDTLPRDELFQASVDDLYGMAMGILHLQERQRLRLFVRRDLFERFISCLVYVPRERYDTNIRLRLQSILEQAFNGLSSTFATQFSDSVLARVHFHIRTQPGDIPDYSVAELEQQLRSALLSWEDELQQVLLDSQGEGQGTDLFHRYSHAFPAAYKDDFDARTALGDIRHLESLNDSVMDTLEMRLYRALEDPDGRLYFKVFGQGQPLALSDALPILERMGLRVLAAHPYEITLRDGEQRWVLTFDMVEGPGIKIDVDVAKIRDNFQMAFARVWRDQMENDGFNRLILGAGIAWRDVVMLRAYCKYLLQTRIPFSQDYMQQTLANYPLIVQQLVELFHIRFDPQQSDKREVRMVTLATTLEEALEQVSSLDDDRILRRFLAVIQATLRTNFFQLDSDRQVKSYVSFKFDPSQIPELPLPLPMFEIFVYSPRVEAVHLRGGPAARGGIRWSDRREDFRTEVLGLMKAQMVKNSVIVPVGSKGGFIVKKPPQGAGREALQQEVQACYRTFMCGMLDITDNRVDDKIVAPAQVIRYDEDDPYLVVAADKGTATFSDLANSIAIEYDFWLGDAFASGGSVGYDHKKMGITARGAWESVKRHFRQLGTDIQAENFTVVGIGDMSGDVFGNGMLLSKHIKLLAAFNHLHIFLDPDPDVESSFQERERLFALPRSTWADYDSSLISKGGGIYPRSAKSITLSAEVQHALAIKESRLTPQELINRLLQAPVDLLWNGGIGTYVKAASESHDAAGDRTNDGLRVNGSQLRCKVVGEGGNLGLTQLGRIEYALNGGHILTDAIDNSAGVNCSDHEVNIKILLNQIVTTGDMTEKQRNTLLAEMTDEVAQLVLRQNYLQPQAISITQTHANELLSDHVRVIRSLERSGKLNRALEFLPSDEILAEREAADWGLTAPELAVLLAYSKITLFEELIASDVPEDTFLQQELTAYFPQPLRQRFQQQMTSHPLRREIIATYITNSILNRMGSAYVIRLQEDSGARSPDIARAYSAAREMYQARALWQRIDALDNQINATTQIHMHMESRRLLERTSLWLLRNRRSPLDINAVVAQFAAGISNLAAALPELLAAADRELFNQAQQNLVSDGVSEELAHTVTGLPVLYSALDIIEVATQAERSVVEVAEIYFGLASELQMNWLRRSIIDLAANNHWQQRARAALLNNLYDQGRDLTAAVLRSMPAELAPNKCLTQWLADNQDVVQRSTGMFEDVRASGQMPDLAMLSVALRETGNLLQSG